MAGYVGLGHAMGNMRSLVNLWMGVISESYFAKLLVEKYAS